MTDPKILAQYRATIGIECHVQLNTTTKLFSGASNDARDKTPNAVGVVSPICFGLPGTLPVLNRQVVELAIRAGIALNAEVSPVSTFDRKHYFYPDLPKGYQITQLEQPIIVRGLVEVPLGSTTLNVRITRAHIEEDAGKLTHPEGADYSLVDYNRAGTPLIEIVSEADMHTPAEAKAYAQELYYLMKYAGVTLGDLYHGNMRFDVNISVAKKEATELGTRAEIKNLNSFRSIEKAAEFEFIRQVKLLEKGQKVVQETRGWHDFKQKTFSQRSKEEAQDYRYFPDADLPPIEVTDEQIEKAARIVSPYLPWTIRKKLALSGISQATTNILLEYPDIIEVCLQIQNDQSEEVVKAVCNLLVNTELNLRKAAQTDVVGAVPPANVLVSLVALFLDKKISSNSLLELYVAARQQSDFDGFTAEKFAESQGKLQVSDSGEIEAIVSEVLASQAAQKAIADIRAGNERAVGALVGMVMKQSQGKANPALVSDLIHKRLKQS